MKELDRTFTENFNKNDFSYLKYVHLVKDIYGRPKWT